MKVKDVIKDLQKYNDLIITERLPRHINVAMSRHSNTLIVVGPITNNYDLCVSGGSIERMYEMSDRPFTSEIFNNDFCDGVEEKYNAIKLCKIDDKVMHDIRDNFDINRAIFKRCPKSECDFFTNFWS